MNKTFVLNFCVENERKEHVAWKEGENALKIKEKKHCKKRKVRIRSLFSKDEFFTTISVLSHKSGKYVLVWEISVMILKFEKLFKCFTQLIL